MLSVKDFRFDVWTTKERFNGVERWDDRISLHATLPKKEGEKGLNYISFYFSREEFEDVVKNGGGDVSDGYHKLYAVGDSWTFYNFEMNFRKASGVMEVPYYRLDIPHFVQKLMVKCARKLWAAAKVEHNPYAERATVTFSREQMTKWNRLYGQGKGRVELVADDTTVERLLEASAESNGCDNSLAKNIERLVVIASNTTRGFHHTAKVVIGRDGRDFWFSCKSPDGRNVMNGGVINHGRSGPSDWSLHT
jgi:hypothetical protein